ncbi:MAG: 30S ribosomal protein S15 [Puniceicoccales bacterium]|jgi:small subunit ribosomal protein S15|nr:30S ribosomal protein S15 [Puniceicoccales bacterium]
MPNINKLAVIEKYKISEKDTGSCEVQVALLTERITQLTAHLKIHRKDFHSRRGLIAMTNRRRRLLACLRSCDGDRYTVLIKSLGLRK